MAGPTSQSISTHKGFEIELAEPTILQDCRTADIPRFSTAKVRVKENVNGFCERVAVGWNETAFMLLFLRAPKVDGCYMVDSISVLCRYTAFFQKRP